MADKPVFIDAPEPIAMRLLRSLKRQDFSEWTPEMRKNLKARLIEVAEWIALL